MNAIGALLLTLGLSACMMLPGAFDSSLDVRKDGRFSFAYKGEIQLLAIQEMTDRLNRTSDAAPFAPLCMAEAETRFDEDGKEAEAVEARPRDCTAAEIKEQRATWEQGEAKRKADEKERRDFAKRMLGGLDPDDPQSIAKFAARLERIEGWRSVRHVGGGLFTVDYAIEGRLDRDFVFPTIPGYGLGEPFVHLQRWKSGEVQVRAPGFTADTGMSRFGGMGEAGTALAGLGAATGSGGDDKPRIKAVEGRFLLTTDAAIRTNNSETGPETVTAGEQLRWDIGDPGRSAPEALLRLSPPR